MSRSELEWADIGMTDQGQGVGVLVWVRGTVPLLFGILRR